MPYFFYYKNFSGRLCPALTAEKPQPVSVEGADRNIDMNSVTEVPNNLTLEEAEIEFLSQRGGKYVHRA